MKSNPNPSGSEMIERSRRVADMVDEQLPHFRSTSGCYPQLWVRVIQKYYWRLVRVSYDKKDGSLDIHFYKFENLMRTPAPETVRRRAQERFAKQKKQIWDEVDTKFPPEKFSEEDRKNEFNKLVAKDKYLPTPRKLEIRDKLEHAYRNEFSPAKQSDMSDFV